MPDEYSEDQLIEQPAIKLFEALGWRTMSAKDEVFGPGGTLGRETAADVVLATRLGAAMKRLNPALPPEAVKAAVDELSRDRSTMSLVSANQEVCGMLKDGVTVSIADREHAGQRTARVRVLDWQDPRENDFLVVSQMTFTGALYTCRPDLVAFVNGLPVVVLELKNPGVSARQAFDGNLTSYKDRLNGVPRLFWTNAFLIASNGSESRVGSLTADWDRFVEWKRVEREDEPRRVSLEVMIRGVCEPVRLLDLMENFTLFSEHKMGLVKALAQNHQFLGVNSAIAATLAAREQGHGRGGVFWQTQGSGKSFAMVFFSQKILRRIPGNWTFVVVTDRTELDDQIATTFKATGAVSASEADECHAKTGEQLRALLRGNHRYVFTLIQKFQELAVLSLRRDIIVLTDEAHRTQYDTLALNMRAALPNATFLAFTGTPLIAGEERTRDVFGDYVSIYDFQQSVEDGATVPLFYENRTPELHLQNPELNEDLYELIEAAGLDEEQEKRLERELGRQYQLLTRDDRLETIANDVVRHFLGRGFQGKAMVVSIDKATALRMYDKVRAHWSRERERVEHEIARLERGGNEADPDDLAELRGRLDSLITTDMAVVVSPGQNEIAQMRELGLEILPHRRRMHEEPLDQKFKDPADPFRLVFVCAMWMTGFDAPSCSTIYLDKPMKNHTLMQTIARANRVFPGKQSGLIVDYANVFAALERALAIYGKGTDGRRPVRDKGELVIALRDALDLTAAHCWSRGVNLDAVEQTPAGTLERLNALVGAVDALISPDAVRRELLEHERLVTALYRAIQPDIAVLELRGRVRLVQTVAGSIRARLDQGKADISEVTNEVNRILDDSIAADGFRIRAGGDLTGVVDLSRIDFEALAKRFATSKHRNTELEQLKAAVRAKVEGMLRLNATRADYLARFEDLIASYNAGSRNIDELFRELVALSRTLTEEEQRHVRENLTEEELTIFDVLTRPDPELTTPERDEVKKVARQLLERLKQVLVLDWRERVEPRARIRRAIEETLDAGLPSAFTPDIYRRKVSAVFNHVFESYQGPGESVFTRVA